MIYPKRCYNEQCFKEVEVYILAKWILKKVNFSVFPPFRIYIPVITGNDVTEFKRTFRMFVLA